MKITVTINTDNAAFSGNVEAEVAQCFRQCIDVLMTKNAVEGTFPIRDTNGQTVGNMIISEIGSGDPYILEYPDHSTRTLDKKTGIIVYESDFERKEVYPKDRDYAELREEYFPDLETEADLVVPSVAMYYFLTNCQENDCETLGDVKRHFDLLDIDGAILRVLHSEISEIRDEVLEELKAAIAKLGEDANIYDFWDFS